MSKPKNGYFFIDGKHYIVISQSLIKQFIKRGDVIDYCPWKIYEESINKKYRKTSPAMLNGLYFETKVLGGSAGDGVTHDLPRLRNGKKSTDHIRIDSQVLEARKDLKRYNIQPNKINTQQKFGSIWKGFEEFDVTVLIIGEIDVIDFIEDKFSMIDHKLTQDVTNTFGDFCWGSPKDMDHIQAHTYNHFTGIPFYYFIYDYKPHLKKKVPLPVIITETIKAEFNETVRKTCAIILEQEKKGWEPIPDLLEKRGSKTVNKCEYCRVESCTHYKKIQPINQ